VIVLGVGTRSSASFGQLSEAVLSALSSASVVVADVAVLATLDRRSVMPPVVRLAADFGWELRGFPAAQLAAVAVPSPSDRISGLVGTPSVAEAAALLAAGPKGALIARKRIVGAVTVAIACQLRDS
jgi:cobalt-precorrin 5A hydrolase